MNWLSRLVDFLIGDPGDESTKSKQTGSRPSRVNPDRFIEPYEQAKERGDQEEMEDVLLQFVDATEADAARANQGVAPWPYGKLATLYYKQGAYDKEVEILERFADQPHARGKKPAKLMDRLPKARDRAGRGDNG